MAALTRSAVAWLAAAQSHDRQEFTPRLSQLASVAARG